MNTDNNVFEEAECKLDCENLTDVEAEDYFEQDFSLEEALDDAALTAEEIEEIIYYKLLQPNPAMFCVFGYFPEEPRYRQWVGRLLTHRIGQILDKMGFKTKIALGQSNGVDINVWLNGKPVLVIETKNYNLFSKIDNEKLENAIAKLKEHPCCKKYFIYTQMANEEVLERLNQHGIHTLKIGYQLLPKWFYDSIDPRHRRYRKIDSSDTSKEIRSKLYPMLHSIILENIDHLDVTITL